jgi:hypothetical protein
VWVRAQYCDPSIPSHSHVLTALYTQASIYADNLSVSEVCCAIPFAETTTISAASSAGFDADVILYFQDVQSGLQSTESYLRSTTLSTRAAVLDELDWIFGAICDIYTIEGVLDRANVEEEKATILSLIERQQAIIALDETGTKLGIIAFETSVAFPYGAEFNGRWSNKYLWISFVWVDPIHRNKGVAKCVNPPVSFILSVYPEKKCFVNIAPGI